MVRVNYQREKRLRDLDRQRKQEEKRNRKLTKGQEGAPGEVPLQDTEGVDADPSEPEAAEPVPDQADQ